MPPVGKELEQQPRLNEVAIREVEGYIERVEKQVEVPPKDNTTQPQVQNQNPPQSQQDMGKLVSAQFANNDKPKIVLPLNKQEIESGTKGKVYDGVKWLAEWCIYMIKKYPGRVFYSPPSSTQ